MGPVAKTIYDMKDRELIRESKKVEERINEVVKHISVGERERERERDRNQN